jgi:hypothetical protein
MRRRYCCQYAGSVTFKLFNTQSVDQKILQSVIQLSVHNLIGEILRMKRKITKSFLRQHDELS